VAQRRYYRPELDLLRLFAFLLVFLSHVVPGEPSFFQQAGIPPAAAAVIIAACAGGSFGVDLFFALSSFLITTLLIRESSEWGTINVRRFYVRRMLRIWPLYFAFLFLAPALAAHIVAGENLPLKYLLAFVFLAGNWACVAWGFPHSVTAPLWSVSIEEQFYLSWPLILRGSMRHLALVASALLVVSFVTRAYLVWHGAVHPQIWCNTIARLDPIACGALLALLCQRTDFAPSPLLRVALLLFGCAVFTSAGRYGDFVGTKSLMTYPAVTAGCAAFLLGTLGLRLSPESNVIARAAVYLGRVSYGLYMFHWFFVEAFAVPSASNLAARSARAAAALLATVIISLLSYRFFETPFLRLKERFARIPSRPI
jgi:peptidoglycan/LPS O-acetylase OafA/YrhL